MTITTLDGNYYYTASGMANANVLADFGMAIGGTEYNPSLEIDLDYGVAFSLGLLIDVDAPGTTDDVGAIVIMDLNLSKSNHSDYYVADYDYDEDMMMDIVNDSIPDNVTLNVTVYNNSRGVVFTHSYNMAELETLMGL